MARLLLVDDDPDVSEILVEFLRAEGHDVRHAKDGEEGLRMLGASTPDVVLLDVEMPVLDGPGMAYRMFLEDVGHERIPIVFLSGVADLHLIAAHIGTSYYLAKPFSLDALVRMLDRVLRERTPPTYERLRRESSER